MEEGERGGRLQEAAGCYSHRLSGQVACWPSDPSERTSRVCTERTGKQSRRERKRQGGGERGEYVLTVPESSQASHTDGYQVGAHHRRGCKGCAGEGAL